MVGRVARFPAWVGVVVVLGVVVPLMAASALGEGRLRVVTIGDSVAYDGDPGIRAVLEATGGATVDTRSYGGVGLMRPGIDDYLAEAVAADPDVVVVMLGGWDLAELVSDPAGYARRLDEVAILLTADGARVVWLGMPPTPPREGIEEARRSADRLFAAMADRHRSVVFLDTGKVVGDPDGEAFVRFRVGVDGATVQVRKVRDGRDDGHLCPGGAALLGQAVFDEIRAVHSLDPPVDEWWVGPWTTDPRYDDPDGSCAADG